VVASRGATEFTSPERIASKLCEAVFALTTARSDRSSFVGGSADARNGRPRVNANVKKQGFNNVQFHLAIIDSLPPPGNSVGVAMSNSVINLAPDKKAMLREAFRVLKPGGRVAVSATAFKKSLPPEVS
jgi:SAM-dependent methyltransferase